MPSFEEMMRAELGNMKENLRRCEVILSKAGKDTHFGKYMEGHVDELKSRIFVLETYLNVYGKGERG